MATIEEALRHWRKRYKDDALCGLGMTIAPPPRLPSGVFEFDVATGGGFPKGNMSVVYGGKDTGKSNLVYVTMATFLEDHPDEKVGFMDLERNYDSDYGKLIGIDESRVLFMFPDYGEQATDMIEYLILDVDDVGLIVTDSMAQMVAVKEITKSAEDFVPGGTGLLVSRLCKKTAAALLKTEKCGRRPTVIYTNQVRSKIAVKMGSPRTMPGGNSVQHYASTVISLYGGKEHIDEDVHRTSPARKEISGTIEKKKGPIITQKFEYEFALLPQRGVRVGRSVEDWKLAAIYLDDLGKFGKLPKKGWQIMGHEFRLQKECRTWFEHNRAEVRDFLIDHLMRHPEDL